MESGPKFETTEDIDEKINQQITLLQARIANMTDEEKEQDREKIPLMSHENTLKLKVSTLETYQKMQERPFWQYVLQKVQENTDSTKFYAMFGGTLAGGASLQMNYLDAPEKALMHGAVGALILGALGYVGQIYDTYSYEKSMRERNEKHTKHIIDKSE